MKANRDNVHSTLCSEPPTTSNALHTPWLCVCVVCACVCLGMCVFFCMYVFGGGLIFSTVGDTDFFLNNINSADFYRLRWAKNSLSLQFLTWREIISSKTTAKNHNFYDHLNARLISANTIQFTPILIITIRMRSKLLLQPSVLDPFYPPSKVGM